MQAALQAHVDTSISKTVNCPAEMPFAAFTDLYAKAYAKGLKGCTAYRPDAVTGAVLTPLHGAASGQSIQQDAGAKTTVVAFIPKRTALNRHKLDGVNHDRRHRSLSRGSKAAIMAGSSADFRRAGNVSFVAEKLNAVFGPPGEDTGKGLLRV